MSAVKRKAIFLAVGMQNGWLVDWEDGSFYKEEAEEQTNNEDDS